MFAIVATAVAVVLLTVLTQVGGGVLLVAVAVGHAAGRTLGRAGRWGLIAAVFLVLHVGVSELLLPAAAPVLSGRVRLPCASGEGASVLPASLAYCLLNRNYVRPELRALVLALGADLARAYPGSVVRYLDAGFPFLDGMPLLPHLSHRAGRSIDLAYFYTDPRTGKAMDGTPSSLGYWAYVPPKAGTPPACPPATWDLRWDLDWLQRLWPPWHLDEMRTGAMLHWLTTEGHKRGVARIYLEPHLKKRLGVESGLIRFAGCGAARHDDHLHVEMAR